MGEGRAPAPRPMPWAPSSGLGDCAEHWPGPTRVRERAPQSESRGHRSDPRGSTEVGTQGRLPITLLQGSGRSPLRAQGGQAPAHLLRVPLKPEGGGPWHFTESAWEE